MAITQKNKSNIMKNKIAIYLMSLILFGLVIVGCQKDDVYEIPPIPTKVSTENRTGLRIPMFYPKTIVYADPFDTMQRKQTAFNHAKTDSVRLVKDGQQIYYDTIRAAYQVYVYCGANIYNIRTFAPDRGQTYKIIPNQTDNQVNPTNTFDYVRLEKSIVRQSYYDFNCGKLRKRWRYNIWSNNMQVNTEYINSNRCNSELFLFVQKN